MIEIDAMDGMIADLAKANDLDPAVAEEAMISIGDTPDLDDDGKVQAVINGEPVLLIWPWP